MTKNITWVKRSYTLLELLIVMAVLTLIAGVVGYNVRGSIQDQRFRNEVALIVDEMRLAQYLMIILSSDVHLKFAKDSSGKGIKYWLETEGKLTDAWKPFILRSHRNLEAIRSVAFQELPSNTVQSNNIDLKFLSEGSVMSHGIFIASTAESPKESSAESRAICLYGYPHPIHSVSATDVFCGSEEEAKYDKKLTETTVKEIYEHGKNKKEASSSSKETPPAAA